MAEQACRFRVLALGIAGGMTCAILAMVTGLGAELFNWGTEVRELASKIYIGYEKGLLGVLIGMLWAFADGFLALVIFGVLYNEWVGKPKSQQVPEP